MLVKAEQGHPMLLLDLTRRLCITILYTIHPFLSKLRFRYYVWSHVHRLSNFRTVVDWLTDLFLITISLMHAFLRRLSDSVYLGRHVFQEFTGVQQGLFD